MKATNYLALIILLLMITSCGQVSSLDVNPDIIKTDYSADYDAETKTLEVTGTFTVGGNNSTYVDLVSPSYFEVNESTTKKETNLAKQIFYKYKKYSSDPNSIGNIKLSYHDSLERDFTNYISIPSKVTFMSASRIDKGEDLIIYYQVDDNYDGATSMYISINSVSGSSSRSIPARDVTGDYTMTYSDLEIYIGQFIKIKVCRSKRLKVSNHPSEGGNLTSSYCAVEAEVFIN